MRGCAHICLLAMVSPTQLTAKALIDARGFGLKKHHYHSLGISSELGGLDSYQLYNPAVASLRDRSNPLSINLSVINKSYGQNSTAVYDHSEHLAYAFRNPYGEDILIELKNASRTRNYTASSPENYAFKNAMNITDVGFSFSRGLFQRLMLGARARIQVNQLNFTIKGDPQAIEENLLSASDSPSQESLTSTDFILTTQHAHLRTSLALDLGFILGVIVKSSG